MSGALTARVIFYGSAQLAWQDRAVCAQTDPETFFVEKGGSTRPAKAVCRNCPVTAECLEYALEHNEAFGVWAGLSERDRRRLKKRFGENIAAAVASVTGPGQVAA